MPPFRYWELIYALWGRLPAGPRRATLLLAPPRTLTATERHLQQLLLAAYHRGIRHQRASDRAAYGINRRSRLSTYRHRSDHYWDGEDPA